MSIIQVNPYSFYDWWRSVTFPTWDPASPQIGNWVLSNGNLTAALGSPAAGFDCIQTNVSSKGVVSGKVRALEFKYDSVGPMTGTKVYAVGVNSTRGLSTANDIYHEFYNGWSNLVYAAGSLVSGVRTEIALPTPAANDVLAFTFDMSATNIVCQAYYNGVAKGSAQTLVSTFQNAGAGFGITPVGSDQGSLGTNQITVTLRTRITEMQYYSSYTGANDGFWV